MYRRLSISKHIVNRVVIFPLIVLSLLASSLAILINSTPAYAAPVASTEELCKAAGGSWLFSPSDAGYGCSGASIADQQSLDWQVKSLLYYRALGKCFTYTDQSQIKASEVTSGAWFNDSDVAIGPYLRDEIEDIGSDSIMSCEGDAGKELVTSALKLWGLKADELLCGAGYTWLQFPNNNARCTGINPESGDYMANGFKDSGIKGQGITGSEWAPADKIADRTDQVLNYLKNKFYGGKTPELSKAGWYTFYRKVFFQQCASGQLESGGTASEPSGSDARDLPITLVDSSGASTVRWYRINAGLMNSSTEYKSFTTRIGDGPSYSAVNKTCKEIAGYTESLALSYAQAVKNNPDKAIEVGGNEISDLGTTSCVVEGIGWIICPAFTFLGGMADTTYNIVQGLLKTNVEVVSTKSGTYQAWSVMRNLANIGFVIVFLIIIFSQLSGAGISNYGVKKMLPRLVVAAILVNLSYFISQIAVDLSNILGSSLKAAIDGLPIFKTSSDFFDTGNTFTSVVGSILAGGTLLNIAAVAGVAAYFGGLSLMVPILIAAVLAILMTLFILVARQALVILLVALSPLAFLAMILPNTEKYFKQWTKVFVSLLILYPAVALLFGVSHLASAILLTSMAETDNSLGTLMALAVLILPLFILPSILKGSLNAIPAIGNFATKWQNKANAGIAKSAKKGYGESRLGQFQNYRKGERDKRRALIQSGAYKTDKTDFLSRARMASSKRNQQINAVTGGFGAKSAAAGVSLAEKMTAEEISNAETLMREQSNPTTLIKDSADALESAIKSGDTVKARAAQKILLSGGNSGIQKLHETIASNITTREAKDSAVAEGLRTDLNNAGLKGKNNILASWAYNDESFAATAAGAATFGGLNDVELAGQNIRNLQDGARSISPDQARAIMANENVFKELDPAKKSFFAAIADGKAQPSSSPSATPTTSTPVPTPKPPTPIQPQPGIEGVGPLNPNNYTESDNGFIVPRDKK